MIAEPFFESFEALVRSSAARSRRRRRGSEGPYGGPIYEFSWGHTRLHVNKEDPRSWP